MKEEATLKPPYLAYATFKNFLNSLNKNGIIPSRIDKTLMPGQSGSTQSYLLSALRFFGVIDQFSAPTDELQAIVTSSGEERKQAWRRIFDKAYQPIISGLNLERATLGQLNEVFAKQDLNGDTLRKCQSFFASAAEDAGVPLAPHLKPKNRGSGGLRKPRKARPTPKVEEGSTGNGEQGNRGQPHSQQPSLPDGSATLLLDKNGTRRVQLSAPPTVTRAELERIQQWLGFQLIVED